MFLLFEIFVNIEKSYQFYEKIALIRPNFNPIILNFVTSLTAFGLTFCPKIMNDFDIYYQ